MYLLYVITKFNKTNNAILTASVFIRSVFAIGFVVAEESFIDTFSVTTREFTIWADGFICLQFGQSLARSYNQGIVKKLNFFLLKI